MACSKVAVVLSGCGFMDGAEIHEATLTLLALDRAGAAITVAAPDVPQARVVDHASGREVREMRNVLVESARIARGSIVPLSTLRAADFDAVVLPGGYGAALNLSDFAKAGAGLSVEPSVLAFLSAAVKAGKALCALCIAPPILAKALGDAGIRGVRLTIGTDPGVAGAIEALGQVHVECAADSCVVDKAHRVVTGPAYMTAGGIGELWTGIEKAINALMAV